MAEQVYYDGIEVGMELPVLTKHPTTQQLVKWAGASGDYYPIHYDKDFAQSSGLKGVIVHGWLSFSFVGQLITNWIGEMGTLKKIGCSYKGMFYPENDIICRGKVTKKYIQDNEHYVECDIWAENPEGEKMTTGNATVILPSRK